MKNQNQVSKNAKVFQILSSGFFFPRCGKAPFSIVQAKTSQYGISMTNRKRMANLKPGGKFFFGRDGEYMIQRLGAVAVEHSTKNEARYFKMVMAGVNSLGSATGRSQQVLNEARERLRDAQYNYDDALKHRDTLKNGVKTYSFYFHGKKVRISDRDVDRLNAHRKSKGLKSI
jgi:hypothetical protein